LTKAEPLRRFAAAHACDRLVDVTEVLPLNTEPLPLKLRVEDYLMLDEAGAFESYGKTELLDGEIYYMNAQHRPHAWTKSMLYIALVRALERSRSGLEALVEASISMPDHSVPEPDIVVTSEARGKGLVPLASVSLVVEVADNSLAQDLGRKAQLYARDGVPEYWVVDVNARAVRQLWAPVGDSYGEHRDSKFGDVIHAATIAGLSVETGDL
jgi:Uma2 family endonuclease